MDQLTEPGPPRPDRSSQLVTLYSAYLTDLGNIGDRQSQTNAWYVTILSGLVAFMGYIVQDSTLRAFDYGATAGAAFIGMVLCVMWLMRAKSYQYLYDAKLTVLRAMEAEGLPFDCFTREKAATSLNRRRFTTLEQWLSGLLAIPFVVALVFSIVRLVRYV